MRACHRWAPPRPPSRQRRPLRRNQGAFRRRIPPTSAIRTAHEHDHEPTEPQRGPPTSRVQLALDWEGTSGRGWGPVRLVDCHLQVASRLHPRPSLAARTQVCTRHQPSAHEPGAVRQAGPLSPSMTPEGVYAPEGATHRRFPGHGPRAPKLVCARSRELYPGSIRSSTSCHGAAPIPGGEPDTDDRRSGRSQTTIRATPPRKPCSRETRGASDPRAPVRPARAGRPRPPPAVHGRRRRTGQLRPEPACASQAYTPGTVGRSNRSRSPTTQGLGLASPDAPRRATRSAIPEVLSAD